MRVGQVWWTRRWRDRSALLSRPLAGGAPVDHAAGAHNVAAFGFEGADVYWMDTGRHWLMRRKL